MRVIAGTFRGRPLAAPKGQNTRPTTDRVKESCMSALDHAREGFDGAHVLDAFAGSGSLGIEALSRGAEHCTFCENAREALLTLHKNIDSLSLQPDSYRIVKQDIFKRPPAPSKYGAYDVVFLDPPYKCTHDEVLELVLGLLRLEYVDQTWYLVYEHAATSENLVLCSPEVHSVELTFSKKYGDTTLDIYEIRSQQN